jgi:hypothetical protein
MFMIREELASCVFPDPELTSPYPELQSLSSIRISQAISGTRIFTVMYFLQLQ